MDSENKEDVSLRDIKIAIANSKCRNIVDSRFDGLRGELAGIANSVYRVWEAIKFLSRRNAIDITEIPYYKELEKDGREVEYRNLIMKAAYEHEEKCLECSKDDEDCLKKIKLKLPKEPAQEKSSYQGVLNERS